MKHRETHPVDVEGCYGCKLLGLQITPSAMPSRGQGAVVAGTNEKEKVLHQDRDAYKRLRMDGLHPRTVDGARDLERNVNSQFDIDLGRIIPKEERSRVEEGMAMVREGGLLP